MKERENKFYVSLWGVDAGAGAVDEAPRTGTREQQGPCDISVPSGENLCEMLETPARGGAPGDGSGCSGCPPGCPGSVSAPRGFPWRNGGTVEPHGNGPASS